MGTVSVPSSTLCLISGAANGDICFFGQKKTGAERVTMATSSRVSFCFFWDAHLWCQVSRTLLQYFQRYRLFSILPFLFGKYDVITDLICIIEKRQYL